MRGSDLGFVFLPERSFLSIGLLLLLLGMVYERRNEACTWWEGWARVYGLLCRW